MLKDLFRIPDPNKNIANHVDRTLSLLASQFSNSPLLKGLLSVYVSQIQELQNVAQDLYDFRSINSAYGVQLDLLGTILNVPRLQGENDNAYRERLRFKSFLIFSSGTPEQIMEILRVNSQATFVQYYDIFPAAYQMLTNGGAEFPDNSILPPDQQLPHSFISQLLHESSPAAVQFVPVTATYGVPLVFGFGADIKSQALVVRHNDEPLVPLYSHYNDPIEYQYYVNSGLADDIIEEGGFADVENYFVLGLDDGGLLILDDGSNLLLYNDQPFYDTPGAGQLAEMLYYSE